jgi:ribose/xylose/arabinose/galactoside ABC-type transport system permease subunit
LGLYLFLDNLALLIWSPDFRVTKVSYAATTFMIQDVIFSFPRLMAFLFAFVVAFLLYLFLKKTDVGKAIRAISDEKVGAMLMGINVKRINYITFGIGSACAGRSRPLSWWSLAGWEISLGRSWGESSLEYARPWARFFCRGPLRCWLFT